MMETTWQEIQSRYYSDPRAHSHLEFNENSLYAKDLVAHVLSALEWPESTVEVGSGSGRFTPHIADWIDVVAIDASFEMGLNAPRRSNIRQICGDASETLGSMRGIESVCGFFILHHVEDREELFDTMYDSLKTGSRVCFVEPNRLNPLFFLQVLFSKEMTWRAERGMFKFNIKKVKEELKGAWFSNVTSETFGFFPPQVLDRWPWTLKIQKRIENMRIFKMFLPFHLITAMR
jgi:SAM-dependent methyltransferase